MLHLVWLLKTETIGGMFERDRLAIQRLRVLDVSGTTVAFELIHILTLTRFI
jgi:hypothetical protein